MIQKRTIDDDRKSIQRPVGLSTHFGGNSKGPSPNTYSNPFADSFADSFSHQDAICLSIGYAICLSNEYANTIPKRSR